MFICCLFSVYLYVLAFLFTTTIVLIFLDRSWGPIPHWYLKLLERIHEKFQEVSVSMYTIIILIYFYFQAYPGMFPYELSFASSKQLIWQTIFCV